MRHISAIAAAMLCFVPILSVAGQPKCPDTSKNRSGTPYCDRDHIAESFPDVPFCEDPDTRRRKQCPKEWLDDSWALARQGDIDPPRKDIEDDKNILACRSSCSAENEAKAKREPNWKMPDAFVAEQICHLATQITGKIGSNAAIWKSLARFSPATTGEIAATLAAAEADKKTYCKK